MTLPRGDRPELAAHLAPGTRHPRRHTKLDAQQLLVRPRLPGDGNSEQRPFTGAGSPVVALLAACQRAQQATRIRRTGRARPHNHPHVSGRDTQPVGKVGDGDDDAAPEADALDVAGSNELVGGGAGDAEDRGGLIDGEGERLNRGGGPENRHEY